MITKEKLNIFNRYSGDIDGLERMGREKEKNLFEKNEWSLIDNFYQDLDLINNGLTAKLYNKRIIRKLKENCDSETFELLSSKIQ